MAKHGNRKRVVGTGDFCNCGKAAYITVERGGSLTFFWKGGNPVASVVPDGCNVEHYCRECYELDFGIFVEDEDWVRFRLMPLRQVLNMVGNVKRSEEEN